MYLRCPEGIDLNLTFVRCRYFSTFLFLGVILSVKSKTVMIRHCYSSRRLISSPHWPHFGGFYETRPSAAGNTKLVYFSHIRYQPGLPQKPSLFEIVWMYVYHRTLPRLQVIEIEVRKNFAIKVVSMWKRKSCFM